MDNDNLKNEIAELKSQLDSSRLDISQLAAYVKELLKVKETMIYTILGNEQFMERRMFSLVDASFKRLNQLVLERPKCFDFIPETSRRCEMLSQIVPVEVITLDDSDDEEEKDETANKLETPQNGPKLMEQNEIIEKSQQKDNMIKESKPNLVNIAPMKIAPPVNQTQPIKTPNKVKPKPEIFASNRKLRSKEMIVKPKKSQVDESPGKFQCKTCGKQYLTYYSLHTHKTTHTGAQFKCTWKECDFTRKHKTQVVAHVRTKHFELPVTWKQQRKLKIVDDRDAREFVIKI